MTEKKQRPQDKWNASHGYISKSYKLHQSIVDDFAEACKKAGTSQKAQLEKMMKRFVKEVEIKEIKEEIKKEGQG